MENKLQLLSAAERQLGNFQAYLYDCDGTLADSMLPHKEAWVEEIQAHAPEIDAKTIHTLIDELAGMPGFKTVEVINERFKTSMDPHALAASKEQLFFDRYIHRVTAIDFVVDHLKAQAVAGNRIAVVSGGRKKVVTQILKTLEFFHLVESLICAEDVQHGKPHPEPFLMAASQLGVAPEKCLVLEDAEMGVRSAKAANMKWIRIDHI
jgi:HAD superfamily hydrolase (TIGR01509 family)